MNYEQKLLNFIDENKIDSEHIIFQESCHSVDDACKASGAQKDEFVKNICMIDTDWNLLVCILKWEDKLDTKKVENIIWSKLKFATAEEILEKTWYICGWTPSFGYEARFFVDERVLEKEIVYSWWWSEKSLLKVSPKEILRVNKWKVVEIKK